MKEVVTIHVTDEDVMIHEKDAEEAVAVIEIEMIQEIEDVMIQEIGDVMIQEIDEETIQEIVDEVIVVIDVMITKEMTRNEFM